MVTVAPRSLAALAAPSAQELAHDRLLVAPVDRTATLKFFADPAAVFVLLSLPPPPHPATTAASTATATNARRPRDFGLLLCIRPSFPRADRPPWASGGLSRGEVTSKTASAGTECRPRRGSE